MNLAVAWEKDKTADSDGIRAVVRTSLPQLPENSPKDSNRFIESFCLPSLFVVVTFSSIPLKYAAITAFVPKEVSAVRDVARPTLVHYGFATTHSYQWREGAHDAFFRPISEENDSYYAQFDLSRCEQDVLGLSFVLQLADRTWVKSGEMDFYVGGGKRKHPCTVEIPFRSPIEIGNASGEMLSLYRANPFWLRPQFGASALSSCRQETQFVLASLGEGVVHREIMETSDLKEYCTLLLLIDVTTGLRASLFGVPGGPYCGIRLENGRCYPLEIEALSGASICVASFHKSPFTAISSAVQAGAELLTTFSSRWSKIGAQKWYDVSHPRRSGVLNTLGFCTWDAFGHKVCQEAVKASIKWFKGQHVPVKYVIIDDGWQAGGAGGPNYEYEKQSDTLTDRPTLSSFLANEKFSGSLKQLSEGHGIEVIAWVAITGYWGGMNGAECVVDTFFADGAPSVGLFTNGEEDLLHWTKKYEVGLPSSENLAAFFDAYFRESLAGLQSVSGVKVDAQSILEMLCNPQIPIELPCRISRASMVASYRKAMTEAAKLAFPDTVVVNCMACSPESLFLSGEKLNNGNVCWRTSNDHAFPGVEETASCVGWHILSNSMNSLLVGEIVPITDWDMFRACDEFAGIHAAARVASGGPLYFSDTVPFEGSEGVKARKLLRQLTTSDGSIVLCEGPGRPTIDCLFSDPREHPMKLFKVQNRNSVLGLLAIFNLDCSKDQKSVRGYFRPDDVEDFARSPVTPEYISLVAGCERSAYLHRNGSHSVNLDVFPMGWVLVHICPVFKTTDGIRFAFLGQPGLLNCGGGVASFTIVEKRATDSSQTCVEASFRDNGQVYVWLDIHSRTRLLKVTTSGSDTLDSSDVEKLGEIELLIFDVPKKQPFSLKLYFL